MLQLMVLRLIGLFLIIVFAMITLWLLAVVSTKRFSQGFSAKRNQARNHYINLKNC